MSTDGCYTCELGARRNRGEAPLWDSIVRTPYWDVVHAYGTSVEGWTVLALRRHITAVADLTDAEATELGPLVRDVSSALREVVGCPKTYVAQFAEHRLHPHVHVHVVPRYADQPPELQGPGIFGALGVAPDRSVSEARMTEIARSLRAGLGH